MTARRMGMQGRPMRVQACLMRCSWALGGGQGWKMPSGALRMPSMLPVTPMKDSALS